ncbi:MULTISPECIES: hypothetical protein [unclassified Streptomyces]|uniref:hypothetical protein n=1 Tax=unclassified Streptomyces TaxID=2593676 RepID=UPI0034511151
MATTLTAGLTATGMSGTAAAATRSTPAAAASAMAPAQRAIDPGALNLGYWMESNKDILGERPLNRIVMPGSHDAGSWSVTDRTGFCEKDGDVDKAKLSSSITASVSVAQISPIAEQLNNGSRYLDLRVCKQNGRWFTHHAGAMGGLFHDPVTGGRGELDEIAAWIRGHPDEIVTIELRTPAADTENTEALELLRQAVGVERFADEDQLSPTSTYNQFMAAGANVVLLDYRNTNTTKWAWSGSELEDRNSYASGATWQQIANALAVTVIEGSDTKVVRWLSQRTIAKNDVALRGNGGDPAKFFKLQGVVDTMPLLGTAGASVLKKGWNWKPDGLPYLLYLAREHNTAMLERLEGGLWGHTDIANNTNIVMIDWVDMGGRRADGTVIGTGDMSRAIIANNTAPVRPGTLVSTERQADGNWSAVQAVPGAYSSAEFSGSERVATAMPNGDLQFVAYGEDKRLYHNTRRADGSWAGWARANDDEFDKRFAGGPLAITSTPNGDAHMLAIDQEGYLNHNIRRADATWQGWGRVVGGDKGGYQAKDMAITSMPNGIVKVAAFGQDGGLRMAERWSNGSWDVQVFPWRTLPGVGAATFAGKDLSITGTQDNTVHIAAVGNDNRLYHMIQNARREFSPWAALDTTPGDPMRGSAVAMTALRDGSVQVAGVGIDGNTYHSIRAADGRWSVFGAVRGLYGNGLGATGLSITALPNGSTYLLAGAR